MFEEGEIVIFRNYKKVEVVGIIIPNAIFEIKDLKTDKVLEVSYKDLRKLYSGRE